MAKEGLNIAGLEQVVRSQLVHVNDSLARVTDGRVPPISDSQVKFITEAQANEIARGVNGYTSWAFALGNTIYYVKERTIAREKSIASMPSPFNSITLKSVFALAHEGLHLGVQSTEAEQTTRDIAFTCWDALYQETVDLTDDSEVPPGVKDEFRAVNNQLKNKEQARVTVNGTTLSIGTQDLKLYEFGRQQDEDFIDYMATMVFEDIMVRRLKAPVDEKRARATWLLNGDNRDSLEPDSLMGLWNQLRDLIGGGSKKRFMDAYFKGRFYEEFISGLDEEQRMHFSCYLVLDETAKALETARGII